MPKGISLHVGINKASSAFPGAATLKGCEKDALDMEQIAIAKGFAQHDVLLGPDATYVRVTTKVRNAAAALEKGDFFFFTFAGHGFQETDIGQDQDETGEDRLDETMLLFDMELFDDVWRKELFPCFQPGVRIVAIADCCHSGSIFLIPGETLNAANLETNSNVDVSVSANEEFPVTTPGHLVARTISNTTGRLHQAEYGAFYRSALLPIFNPKINARVLTLSACKPNETTGDGPNGVFTAAMLKVLKEFDPVDYHDLVNKIQTELTDSGHSQTVVLDPIGTLDPELAKDKPFTI